VPCAEFNDGRVGREGGPGEGQEDIRAREYAASEPRRELRDIVWNEKRARAERDAPKRDIWNLRYEVRARSDKVSV
jgi:hypothetical protein